MLIKGTALVWSGEEGHELREDGIVHLPRNVPHAYRITSERAGLLMIATPGGIEGMFREQALLIDSLGLDLLTVQDHPYQAASDDTWTLLTGSRRTPREAVDALDEAGAVARSGTVAGLVRLSRARRTARGRPPHRRGGSGGGPRAASREPRSYPQSAEPSHGRHELPRAPGRALAPEEHLGVPGRSPAMTVEKITDLAPQLANCRDYWLGWGEADRADDSLTYYRSGLAHGQLNGVLRLRSSDEGEVRQALVRAESALAGVPWLWWVGPDSADGVADRLVGSGAERVGAMPVMAVALDRVADVAGPPELKTETVEGTESLTEWVRTYSPSFGVVPELEDDVVRLEAGRADTSRIVRIVARLEGEAVGTALMLDAHGVAGIYIVATAERHRRRGIGAALTAAALEAGRQRGLRVGTLQASGLGAPVYRRMGFEKVAEYQLFRAQVS